MWYAEIVRRFLIILAATLILGFGFTGFLIFQKQTKKPPELLVNIENNCIGFLSGNPQELKTITKIGGAWVRPHPGPFAWGWIEPEKGRFFFKETDMWVKESQKNNLAILATIWPYADWDQEVCHSSECKVAPEEEFYPKGFGPGRVGIPISRCVPCSLQDYKNFVAKMVERYDGDGIEDMPGLKIPIKYWEVLNEPEMAEPRLTFFIGTQEEYVEILKASNQAIKSACLDCKVVQGGAQHSMPDNLAWWEKVFDWGGANYFDVANIHYIREGDLSTLNVKAFKALMQKKGIKKPIWVTEAQYRSENEIELSVDGALNAGASKIFFTQFEVGRFGVPLSGEYSRVYERIPSKCR